jgi:hypothetical protein
MLWDKRLSRLTVGAKSVSATRKSEASRDQNRRHANVELLQLTRGRVGRCIEDLRGGAGL